MYKVQVYLSTTQVMRLQVPISKDAETQSLSDQPECTASQCQIQDSEPFHDLSGPSQVGSVLGGLETPGKRSLEGWTDMAKKREAKVFRTKD